MRPFHIIRGPHLRDVEHGGADGHRDGLRRWRHFREHVTRVVVQPLGLGAVALGREGDRAADLDDHLGHGFLEARHHEVVVLDIRREVPGRGVAHVEVQDPGAGVVAIHRRLDLLVPGHGDVGRVARQPRRPIRRRGDDQRLHVLGIQRVVGVTHELFLLVSVSGFCVLIQSSGSGIGIANGSACQMAKMFPSGSATTAYHAAFGTAVFGRTTDPPSSTIRSTV